MRPRPVLSITGGILCFCLLLNLPAVAQYQTLVSDSFKVESPSTDLSKILLWGTNPGPVSAFQRIQKGDKSGLIFPCLALTDSSLKYGSGYTDPRSLKTCTAIDYPLPSLPRDSDSLKIEFDAYWDTLIQIGEGGRIVMALLYDYPANGIPFGLADSVSKPSAFGRPAYNIRILNRSPSAGGGNTAAGYLFYGGGNDPLGEFEKTSNWWLPGFIAQPGGLSPQTGPSYPSGATTKIYTLMANQNDWMHFTFKIFPEHVELWMRKTSQPTSANQLFTRVLIPKTQPGVSYTLSKLNQFYNTNLASLPLYYRWFPKVEAVRFYFRSANRAYLTNVRVGWSGNTTTETKKDRIFEGVRVFPNPGSMDGFWTNLEAAEFFELTDLYGRKVKSGSIQDGWIETRGVAPGIYQLSLTSGRTNQSHKVSVRIL